MALFTGGGAGSAGGTTAAVTRIKVVDPHIVTMMRDVMDASETAKRLTVGGGSGGAGGGAGGIVFISAATIANSGVIRSHGGAGGAGGDGIGSGDAGTGSGPGAGAAGAAGTVVHIEV